MGHHISAVLLRGAYEREQALAFDLRPILLTNDIDLFPLDAAFCDHWAEKLNIMGIRSERPILNCNIVHHMIKTIALEPLFAVIETDYFGSNGDQSAAVYHGDSIIMEPKTASIGPINEALRHLGVYRIPNLDEFDTLGLSQYRNFDDMFQAYHDRA